jgi:hypothetical protein
MELAFELDGKAIATHLKRGIGFVGPIPDQRQVYRLLRQQREGLQALRWIARSGRVCGVAQRQPDVVLGEGHRLALPVVNPQRVL